ncbi:MAG TPA: cell division topological specificity factor MinE [Candidatus Blautia stercoripullorum]|uniref:Cell division topological specificity factor MinE n=1 Tax=Candidatus Blautia stercoripullorum TaxID=2838502 RepID=A0A9D2U4M4_9FIRM|nr:cell division topological specificity factor MinE [Candidatus Blautia stercoripullorum]
MRFPGRRSGLVAKDRLKLVLTSERLDCTPQMMTMLKNDMIRAVDKYFSVQDKKVEIRYIKDRSTLLIKIPLQSDIEKSAPGMSFWR